MRRLIVTGLPATGKSTLARQLSLRYDVPLLCKDTIKERLFETLGVADAAHSRRLSDASFQLMFDLAAEQAATGSDVILEGNFRSDEHEPALRALPPAHTIQILCRVEEAERNRRLSARAAGASRHPGHLDGTPAPLRPSTNEFLALPGERMLYDTTVAGASQTLLQMLDARWRAVR